MLRAQAGYDEVRAKSTCIALIRADRDCRATNFTRRRTGVGWAYAALETSLIVAGRKRVPKNTLAAFGYAATCGYDGVELDVQLTRDSEVVVFHDYRLKPELCRDEKGQWLTPPTPRLKDITLAELKRVDVGRADPTSAYAREHPHVVWRDRERIPTLAEVVATAKKVPAPFYLFVELKTSYFDRDLSALPEELAERTLAVLKAQDYLERTVFIGFDWPGLLRVKQIAPSAQCWFSTLPQSWFRDGAPPQGHPPPEPARQMFARLGAGGELALGRRLRCDQAWWLDRRGDPCGRRRWLVSNLDRRHGRSGARGARLRSQGRHLDSERC